MSNIIPTRLRIGKKSTEIRVRDIWSATLFRVAVAVFGTFRLSRVGRPDGPLKRARTYSTRETLHYITHDDNVLTCILSSLEIKVKNKKKKKETKQNVLCRHRRSWFCVCVYVFYYLAASRFIIIIIVNLCVICIGKSRDVRVCILARANILYYAYK